MLKRTVVVLVVLMLIHLSVQNEDANEGWIAVEQYVTIDWDLEEVPLQISTNSRVGSWENLVVHLYNEQREWVGSVKLHFTSPPKYWLTCCLTSWHDLPTSLPTDEEKILTIYRTPVGVKIDCNGVEIVDFVLSDSTCDYSSWRRYWTQDVAKIQFWGSGADKYRRKPTGWIPVKGNVVIDWDLEDLPLQIKTNSRAGSREFIGVNLYNEQGRYAGRVVLLFTSPPQYLLKYCTSYQTLPTCLPADEETILTIYRTRVTIECNGVQIPDFVVSDSTCDRSNWREYWTRDVTQILISSSNSASDSYRAKPSETCEDENEHCPVWAEQGICDMQYAARSCKKSCNLCDK